MRKLSIFLAIIALSFTASNFAEAGGKHKHPIATGLQGYDGDFHPGTGSGDVTQGDFHPNTGGGDPSVGDFHQRRSRGRVSEGDFHPQISYDRYGREYYDGDFYQQAPKQDMSQCVEGDWLCQNRPQAEEEEYDRPLPVRKTVRDIQNIINALGPQAPEDCDEDEE